MVLCSERLNLSLLDTWGFGPILDRFIGECMVSISTFNGVGIIIMMPVIYLQFGGYLKWRESWYSKVNWDNVILNYIDFRTTLPRYEGSCIIYRPEWSQKHNAIKYMSILNCYQRNVRTSLHLPKGINKRWY